MRKSFFTSVLPKWPRPRTIRLRSMLLKAFAAAAMAFGGCKFSELEAPTWSPDVLVPTAHMRLSAEDLQAFDDLKYSVQASATDIGIPEGTYLGMPAMNFQTVGPFNYTIFEQVADLSCERFVLAAELTNEFPFDISAGARLVLRNSDNGSTFLSHTFDEPIASGETINFEQVTENAEVNSEFRVYLENVQTELVQSTVEINGENGLFAQLSIDFEDINQVRYYADQRIDHSDTIAFELGLGDLDELDPSGVLTIKLENNFPMEGGFQLYFLPKSQAYVLDSLFIEDMGEFETPPMDAEGLVSQSATVYLDVPVDKDRLLAIRPAKFVAIRTAVRSPETPALITANRQNYIDLRIIADLNVTVK